MQLVVPSAVRNAVRAETITFTISSATLFFFIVFNGYCLLVSGYRCFSSRFCRLWSLHVLVPGVCTCGLLESANAGTSACFSKTMQRYDNLRQRSDDGGRYHAIKEHLDHSRPLGGERTPRPPLGGAIVKLSNCPIVKSLNCQIVKYLSVFV